MYKNQLAVQNLNIILTKEGKVSDMGKLAGKKLLLLGERDGVPGPAMEACLKDSGAEIIFSATECFV